MKLLNKKRKGFTLIEMTIVLFIISLLILIVIPNVTKARQHAETVHRNAMVSMIKSQIDTYLDENPGKKRSDVTEATLGDNKYLSKDQITKINDEGIQINNGEVE